MRESNDAHSRAALRAMLWLMLALWNSYPAVWLLSEANLISPALEQV